MGPSPWWEKQIGRLMLIVGPRPPDSNGRAYWNRRGRIGHGDPGYRYFRLGPLFASWRCRGTRTFDTNGSKRHAGVAHLDDYRDRPRDAA